MNPIWRRLDASAGAAVQRLYAENIRVTPRIAASDYAAALPDASRPTVELRAVYAEETKQVDLRGQRLTGESRGTTNIINLGPSVQIMAAEFVARLGYEPRAGDLVTLLDRSGQTFAVSMPDMLDTGDLVLYLSPEKVIRT